MDWSLIIKELRNKMLVTQTELAGLIGVSFATINRWENKKNEPTMKQKRTIKKLCADNDLMIGDM